RIAYFHRIPRERTDRHDRIVADRYHEMLRIDDAMHDAVAGVLRAAGRARVECVIRFGSPMIEIARETEAYAADAVAFVPGVTVAARWRAWRVLRQLAAYPGVRVLVLEGTDKARRPIAGAMRPA